MSSTTSIAALPTDLTPGVTFTTSTAALSQTSTDSPPTMSSNPQTLDDHIQSLPQELQDEILEYFCLAQAESVKSVIVHKSSYRPPYFLQLDRRTRALAAPTYYNRTAFLFRDDRNTVSNLELWLSSIPSAYRASLRALCIMRTRLEGDSWYIGYRLERLRRALHDMDFRREGWLLRVSQEASLEKSKA